MENREQPENENEDLTLCVKTVPTIWGHPVSMWPRRISYTCLAVLLHPAHLGYAFVYQWSLKITMYKRWTILQYVEYTVLLYCTSVIFQRSLLFVILSSVMYGCNVWLKYWNIYIDLENIGDVESFIDEYTNLQFCDLKIIPISTCWALFRRWFYVVHLNVKVSYPVDSCWLVAALVAYWPQLTTLKCDLQSFRVFK